MQQKKLNFFEQIRYAVTRPMQYYRLTRISGGRLIGFVFLFILITSLFFIIPMTYNLVGPNGFTQYLREDFPAFEFSNGELHMDEVFEEEDGHSYILVNTNIDEFTSDDVSPIYRQVLLISKTNMVNYNLGRIQIVDFKSFGGIRFDNTIINILMPFMIVIMIIVMIIVYLASIAFFLFSALLYSIVGLIVNALSHANLKYAAIFKTAIYSKITVAIISAVLSVTPIVLPHYLGNGLSILITCAYVVYGTLSHTTEAAYKEAGLNTPPNHNFG